MHIHFREGFEKTGGKAGKLLKTLGIAAGGAGLAGTTVAAMSPEERKKALEKAREGVRTVKETAKETAESAKRSITENAAVKELKNRIKNIRQSATGVGKKAKEAYESHGGIDLRRKVGLLGPWEARGEHAKKYTKDVVIPKAKELAKDFQRVTSSPRPKSVPRPGSSGRMY